MRKDHNTSLYLLINGKLKFDHKQDHDRRQSDAFSAIKVGGKAAKSAQKEYKDEFCCCLCPFCPFTRTGNGKKICLVDCREQPHVLQALQTNSIEKLQGTGLPLLSRILFTLSRTARPIVWGVTLNSAVLQRRGWRVDKRKDIGCFLLSSALPAHPRIMQAATRFLSSETLGNLQNLPRGGWLLSAAALAFCTNLTHHHHLISTVTWSQSIHFLTHLSSHFLHAEIMQWDACPVTTLQSFAFDKAVSWRRSCSLQGSLTGWPLKVPSNPNTSMILWKYGKAKFLTVSALANDEHLLA